MEWPEGKGEPELHLKYDEDDTDEWADMRLFGDTVVPIAGTKKMKHNIKDKTRKQDQVVDTETFPHEVTA